ncbi:response regulator [Nocardioides aurantiacus]|uniref:LuxR family two component transcriptional regulator n=1 Tax=Nocardioides aurantiacus TaxID=86796 RepID=A0A3N2CTK4_9ACTN|nr:response regulator transcription factor [Nocardioides aurantiacus]ROR90863.1 LuxR family two component transcriptional regulator [Nocardioides aurantiacus]
MPTSSAEAVTVLGRPDGGSGVGDCVRVVIVDDHQLFVDSVSAVLGAQPGLCVVGSAGTLGGALAELAAWSPDVLVLDRQLPDGDAIASLPEVRQLVPEARIVMLTSHDDAVVEQRALRAGVHAYVRKTAGLGEVLHAVRSDVPSPVVGPTSGVALTARESEVLALVAEGLTNPAIAERLGLSPFTIGNQVASLRVKLGAHSKLDLVSRARREGFLF